MIKVIISDGGRAAAGLPKAKGDCVCKSIAIASGLPYLEVRKGLKIASIPERQSKRKQRFSCPDSGMYKATFHKYILSLGATWTPTMFIGSGCKVHVREDELPMGRLILSLSGHVCAMIDRVIYDSHDPSRNGTRCVYGYYQFK